MGLAGDALREEAELVERLKRGDEDAFEELVRQHSRRLVALARGILGEEELARDAVQEAFLNAYRAMDGFSGDARLSSWLYRIVANTALATIRRRRRRPEILVLEESISERIGAAAYQADSPARSSRDADEALARRQERELVRECVARMKERHRSVLTLRYLEEYDTEETAEILGIAPNTVKTRLLRAREALRRYIENEVEIAAQLVSGPLSDAPEGRRAA